MSESDRDTSKEPWAQLVSVTDLDTSPVPIYKDKFVFGRNADCDLPFTGNKLVSGRHCYLERSTDGRVWIYDTSTNGTLVNSKIKLCKGECQELHHGDEFHIIHKKSTEYEDIGFVFQDVAALEAEMSSSSDTDATQNGGNVTLSDDDINDVPDTPSLKRKCDASPAAVDTKKLCVESVQGSHSSASESGPKPSTSTNSDSDDFADSLICIICTEILHDCISLQPCMHSYCAGCYSEWMERSNECPSCRVKVERINKNHIVNNLVEAYLKTKPDKRRPQAELDELDWKNKITRDMLYPDRNSKGLPVGSYQADSDDEDEDDEDDDSDSSEDDVGGGGILGLPGQCLMFGAPVLPVHPVPAPRTVCRHCPGYLRGLAGNVTSGQAGPQWTCAASQNHALCQCCLQPMPVRPPEVIRAGQAGPQNCIICYRFYCHLYWGCKKAGCNGCIAKLKDMNFGKNCLKTLILDNAFESGIFENYLESKSLSEKNVLDDCLAKMITGEYSCTNQTQLTDGMNTVVCYSCGLKVFKDLAYFYRKDISQDQLPGHVTSRPDCYWGKNCRTQRCKPEHARRFNHICEQTRTS